MHKAFVPFLVYRGESDASAHLVVLRHRVPPGKASEVGGGKLGLKVGRGGLANIS